MNFSRLLVVMFATFFCCGKAQTLDTDLIARQVAQAYLEGEAMSNLSVEEGNGKSYQKALAWGFSPITGAGLYYTEHPVQGSLALLMGVVGIPLLITGLSMDINQQTCDDCTLNNTLIFTGSFLYGSAYLWDSIATIFYGKKYKKKN